MADEKSVFPINLTEEQKNAFYVRVHLTEQQKAEISKATGLQTDAIEVPTRYLTADGKPVTAERIRLIVPRQDLICW